MDGYDLDRARKYPDAWWTVLVVDPVALRVLPLIVARRRITPDGISIASLLLALLAGGAFLQGWFVAGAVLFELHFLLDCIDGKLARVRGTQNPRGGFLDLACDLVGTAFCFAAVGYAAFEHTSHAGLALLAAVGHVTYTWSTVSRSKAGALEPDRVRVTGTQPRRMNPTPYGVDVEALTLFVLPLTTREEWMRWGLWLAVAFFAVATLRNLRATYARLGPVAR
jgi:phosphatidylglycerophosphate synthase